MNFYLLFDVLHLLFDVLYLLFKRIYLLFKNSTKPSYFSERGHAGGIYLQFKMAYLLFKKPPVPAFPPAQSSASSMTGRVEQPGRDDVHARRHHRPDHVPGEMGAAARLGE